MKKIRIILVILVILILISLIFIIKNNNKQISNSNYITYFKYSFGSFESSYIEYEIYQDGDKYIFNGIGRNAVNFNIKKEVQHIALDDIQEIIQKYDVEKWNGFNKRNNHILDGYDFSLIVNYNNKEIKSKGYMKYPNNYFDFEKEIQKYIEDNVINKK